MSAYAVIQTGGKQYRVAEDDVLVIERLIDDGGDPRDEGAEIVFDQVLMIGGAGDLKVGAPLLSGAAVTAEVVEQRRAEKITIIKTRQRNTYMRKKGHRQHETVVRITGISADGAPKPKKKAKAKPDPAPAEAPEADVKTAAEAASETPAAKTPEAAQAGPAVMFLSEPDGKADDLKKLNGVGPALEKKLNALGIYHFRQIAEFSEEDVARVDEVLNFKGRITRDDWIGQAKALVVEK